MSVKLKVIQPVKQEPIEHMKNFSHTALTEFLNCEKRYYWQYIKNLELIKINKSSLERFIGEAVHYGLYLVYSKKHNQEEITKKIKEMFANKLKEYKASLLLVPELEEYFYELEVIAVAMVSAYQIHYKPFIAKVTHIKNEFSFKVPTTTINGKKVYVKGKIDNILKIDGKYFIHEVKTSKYVNNNYIRNIKVQRQTNIYFHYFNKQYKINGQKITGVLYDVIQKPSIRRKVKSGETKDQYHKRLMTYYSSGKRDELFYHEITEHPVYTKDKIFKDVNKLIDRIHDCKTDDDFSHTTERCYMYSEDNYCPYIPICIEGEPNAQNMRLYKPRVDLSKYDNKKDITDKTNSSKLLQIKVSSQKEKLMEKETNSVYADKLNKSFPINSSILPKRRK